MTEKPERHINWSLTTWKGSRLQQHCEFYALSFSRKLELIEQMGEMADQFGGRSETAGPPVALHEDSEAHESQGPASPAPSPKPRKRKK